MLYDVTVGPDNTSYSRPKVVTPIGSNSAHVLILPFHIVTSTEAPHNAEGASPHAQHTQARCTEQHWVNEPTPWLISPALS